MINKIMIIIPVNIPLDFRMIMLLCIQQISIWEPCIYVHTHIYTHTIIVVVVFYIYIYIYTAGKGLMALIGKKKCCAYSWFLDQKYGALYVNGENKIYIEKQIGSLWGSEYLETINWLLKKKWRYRRASTRGKLDRILKELKKPKRGGMEVCLKMCCML